MTRDRIAAALLALLLATTASAQTAGVADSASVLAAPQRPPVADSAAAAPAAAAAVPAMAPAHTPAPPPRRVPTAFRQNVAWSPDGRMIAWSELSPVAPDTTPSWNVWVATSAGTNRERIAVGGTWVDWAPDGKHIVFSAKRDGNEHVYSAKPDGHDEKQLTDGAAAERHPAWSPRGDRIAYCVKQGSGQALFVMNTDGSNPKRVSADSGDADAPAWSTDGLRLVWYSRDIVGRDRLHIVQSDGSGEFVVPTVDAGAIYPCFLSSGRLLYAALTPAGRKLLTSVWADGSGAAVIGGIETYFARPSRDGKRLAFIAGAWPNSRLCVARADGSAARVVVGDPTE